VPALVAEDATSVVAVLFVAKLLAYAVSLGCGFRGGPFFPAVFLGVALATFGVVWFDASPTWAVAVGAAAGMAAQARLVLASLFFGALLVGTTGLDTGPAAVLAIDRVAPVDGRTGQPDAAPRPRG
jgi:H+/Cl- antiporter ClcA